MTINAINSSNPVTVAQGGSGDASFTAYSVICGGTTSTGNLQNVSGVGTSGQALVNNGSSALPTWATQTGGAGIIFTTTSVQLTSAQIKTLHATPITIIANQGAGKAIFVISAAAEMVYGGSNVFVAGASQTITLNYNNGSGTSIGIIAPNAVIVASANSFECFQENFATTTIPKATAENTPIVAFNPIATEISGNAAGDNVINITLRYIVTSI